MILLHCYGKQVVQITEETLLGAVATFHLRDSICGSFSSQSPKPHLLADSCNTPIIAFPVFMFSSWSRKYDRFCIFPNISPQMLVNPLAFKGPQNLSSYFQQSLVSAEHTIKLVKATQFANSISNCRIIVFR